MPGPTETHAKPLETVQKPIHQKHPSTLSDPPNGDAPIGLLDFSDRKNWRWDPRRLGQRGAYGSRAIKKYESQSVSFFGFNFSCRGLDFGEYGHQAKYYAMMKKKSQINMVRIFGLIGRISGSRVSLKRILISMGMLRGMISLMITRRNRLGAIWA
jgi:hypothetical protein